MLGFCASTFGWVRRDDQGTNPDVACFYLLARSSLTYTLRIQDNVFLSHVACARPERFNELAGLATNDDELSPFSGPVEGHYKQVPHS